MKRISLITPHLEVSVTMLTSPQVKT